MKMISVLSIAIAIAFGLVSANALADATLDNIKSTKVLRIGADATAAPLNLKDVDGAYEGFEVDLANAIAKKIDPAVKVQWVDSKWDNLPANVKSKTIDFALNGLFLPPTKAEADWGIYSVPYLKVGISIAYDAKLGNLTLKDFQDKKLEVGIINDFQAISALKKNKLVPKTFDQLAQLVAQFEKEKFPGYGLDSPVIAFYTKQSKGKYQIIKPTLLPGSENSYAALLRKEDKDLTKVVNEAIKEWSSSASVKASLKTKYGID